MIASTSRLPLALLRSPAFTRALSRSIVTLPSPLHPPPSASFSASTTAPATLTAEDDSATHAQLHPADTRKITKVVLPAHSAPHEDWALHHPVYTSGEVASISVVRHKREAVTDFLASGMVAFARWGFDFVTRYKHASPEAALAKLRADGKAELSLAELRRDGYLMSPDQWLMRILFLESIAGVPGFTAAMVRHLHSLRLMRRDGGFINSLLQEAENERMHLMVFLKIKQPSKFFRFMVIAAQGLFTNGFFVAYLISPKIAHRFVAYLEEEAVVTYTQIANELRLGHLPEWTAAAKAGGQQVPQIAKDYWRLPADAKMLDLILQVRADEAGHRFLNHTVANLEEGDFNPFGLKHAPIEMQGTLPGFTREESLAWSKKVEEDLRKKGAAMPRSS